MIKKMVFIVLFLFSATAISAGNVNIYRDGVNRSAYITVIKMCNKPLFVVYNYYGRTKIVVNNNYTDKIKKQILNRISKHRKSGMLFPQIIIPCKKYEGIET